MGSELRPVLDELERRLRAYGAPITEAFHPGAPPKRVREILANERLPVHEDLVTWWSWHDGAQIDTAPNSGPGIYMRAENTLVGGWHVLSLREACRLREWLLEIHDRLGVPHLFPESWVPVFDTDGAGELCADVAAHGPAPLHIRDEGYLDPPPPQFASLSEFAEMVLRAFDEGLIIPDHQYPLVPDFDAASLKGDLRRLCWW